MEWLQTGWGVLVLLPVGALLGAVVARRHGKWADRRDQMKTRKREQNDAEFSKRVQRSAIDPRYFNAVAVRSAASIAGDVLAGALGLAVCLIELIVMQLSGAAAEGWTVAVAWVGVAGGAAIAGLAGYFASRTALSLRLLAGTIEHAYATVADDQLAKLQSKGASGNGEGAKAPSSPTAEPGD